MQLKFSKGLLIRSFCLHIILPVLSLIILLYLLASLNGSYVSPVYQSTISVVIGILVLCLIYLTIKGFNKFFQILLNHLKDMHTATLNQTLSYQNPSAVQSHAMSQPKSQQKFFRWMLILAVGSILLTSFLNPSYQDFKEFTPERKTQGHYAEWKRVNNYLIFSVYEKDIYEREYVEDDFTLISTQKYIGFLKNFVED